MSGTRFPMPLTKHQIDCCRNIGRDEEAGSSTFGLVELDALCDTAELGIRPVAMILYCPGLRRRKHRLYMCGARHIDEGEFATKPHHTHACQVCGHVWRPAIVPTVGVQFLPGFKNE